MKHEPAGHTDDIKQKGTVFIDDTRCKGCAYCITFCPTHALAFSDQLNARGYRLPELSTPQNCNGCDTCGLFCPDFAIYGVRLGKKNKGASDDE